MYYQYFGLRDAPFKFQPSNALFLSSAHLQGLAALEWALQEPSGLTLLVGEVGTGKTVLIHSLIARIKDDKIRIAQVSDPTMNFEQMLEFILQQLRINPIGKGTVASLQALKTFVSDPESTSRAILIFDEAQGLNDEILEDLRLLSNSRPPQRHALQIILVGQPELVHRLTDPKLRALNQRIGARALLRPLRGEEIGDYVNCLLHMQGARRELFSPKALDQVASLSGGFPRKINNLCHNALLHAYIERSSIVEPQHVQAASMELENLLDTSRDDRGERRQWHLMPGRDKPVAAWSFGALAVGVTAALALEFGGFHHNVSHTVIRAKHVQGGNQLSETTPGDNIQTSEESGTDNNPALVQRRTGDQTDNSSWSDVIANLVRSDVRDGDTYMKAGKYNLALSKFLTAAMLNPENQDVSDRIRRVQEAMQAEGNLPNSNTVKSSTASPPSSQTHPVSPQVRPETTASASISGGTALSPEPKMPASSGSNAPGSNVASAPSGNGLSYRQRRRLKYEIRRARSSFDVGRYTNTIYHSKRALVLDPGNTEMRDLLQRAQAAQ
jgi:general secretion pathway protein A